MAGSLDDRKVRFASSDDYALVYTVTPDGTAEMWGLIPPEQAVAYLAMGARNYAAAHGVDVDEAVRAQEAARDSGGAG
jgi:hypothetical protein